MQIFKKVNNFAIFHRFCAAAGRFWAMIRRLFRTVFSMFYLFFCLYIAMRFFGFDAAFFLFIWYIFAQNRQEPAKTGKTRKNSE